MRILSGIFRRTSTLLAGAMHAKTASAARRTLRSFTTVAAATTAAVASAATIYEYRTANSNSCSALAEAKQSWTAWAQSWFGAAAPAAAEPTTEEEHALCTKLVQLCPEGNASAMA
eukprot:gene7247-5457_t